MRHPSSTLMTLQMSNCCIDLGSQCIGALLQAGAPANKGKRKPKGLSAEEDPDVIEVCNARQSLK